MPKVGSLGLDMMFRTCTVQVWPYGKCKYNSFHVVVSSKSRLLKALTIFVYPTDRLVLNEK